MVDSTSLTGLRGVRIWSWTHLKLEGDVGRPVACPNLPDKSIQLTGTFGAGGTVIIEGSNMVVDDPSADATWATLNDASGNALSLTSAGIKQVLENTYWIRPRVTVQAVAMDVGVYLLAETQRG